MAEQAGPGALQPGESLSSESLFLRLGNVFDGLEAWAELTGKRNRAVFMNLPATGFYSWYYYRERVDEEAILSNARYLAENRDRLPVSYVHLDWGWQGNFACGNQNPGPGFPNGLEWLTTEVRKLGFIPGIWLNAFMHDSPGSKLPLEQPELFQSYLDGSPVSFGDTIGTIMAGHFPDMHTARDADQYRIDPTAPGTGDYLRERYGWAREMQFGMVMLDFMLNGVWPDYVQPVDPSFTWEEALRAAMGAIRDAVGDETMIMGCGTPYEPMIGYGNFVRVAPDVPAHWDHVKSGCRALLWQYFMHNRLWTNYADAVSVRGTPSPYWRRSVDGTEYALSVDEARFYVAVTGLTGAAVMIAEDLTQLEPERERLLSLVLPICDEGSFQPVDLFPRSEPRVIRRTFDRRAAPEPGQDGVCAQGVWTVVGLLNWDEDTDTAGVTTGDALSGQADSRPMPDAFNRAQGRSSDQRPQTIAAPRLHHVYDVFEDRYLGAMGTEDQIGPVPGHGARLLRITPWSETPTLVGTTMHISQGAVEADRVVWEEAAGNLVIGLSDLYGRRGEFLLFVPAGWSVLNARYEDGSAISFPERGPGPGRTIQDSDTGGTPSGRLLRVPVMLSDRRELTITFKPEVECKTEEPGN